MLRRLHTLHKALAERPLYLHEDTEAYLVDS